MPLANPRHLLPDAIVAFGSHEAMRFVLDVAGRGNDAQSLVRLTAMGDAGSLAEGQRGVGEHHVVDSRACGCETVAESPAEKTFYDDESFQSETAKSDVSSPTGALTGSSTESRMSRH